MAKVTQEQLDRGDIIDEEDVLLEEEELEEEGDMEEDMEDEEEEELEEEEEEDNDDDDDDDEGENDLEEDDLEEEEEENDDSDNQRIPRSRFNQVIDQRNKERDRVKWLEAQLEKIIEKGTPTPKETDEHKEEGVEKFDFDDAENEYINFILDGETQKAAKLRRKVDSEREKELQRVINEAKTSAMEEAYNKTNNDIEEEKFSTLVDNYENKHPSLDPDSDEYDEDVVDTINTLMSGYISQGKKKSVALKQAVEKWEKTFYKETSKKKLGGRKTRVVSKQENRKKNVRANKQQPPKLKGKGASDRDPDSIDILKLSDKEFENLSEKEKKILRGDV